MGLVVAASGRERKREGVWGVWGALRMEGTIGLERERFGGSSLRCFGARRGRFGGVAVGVLCEEAVLSLLFCSSSDTGRLFEAAILAVVRLVFVSTVVLFDLGFEFLYSVCSGYRRQRFATRYASEQVLMQERQEVEVKKVEGV